jgi:hypothetical protein
MQNISKTLWFVLLAAVITAPLAGLDFHAQAASHEPPAGCHDDGGGNLPASGTTGHVCCQGAHHPAVLQSSSPQVSLQLITYLDSSAYSMAAAWPVRSDSLLIVPGDPPITSPLRV